MSQMDSADPPLGGHRLYADRHRQLRRVAVGSLRLGDLLAPAPARRAPVHRPVLVRAALCHEGASPDADRIASAD